MSDTTVNGPVLAADGKPLKRSLNRALRMQKIRALALIAPLLLFVLVTFIAPIADMLFRSVENEIVADTLPITVERLGAWNPEEEPLPSDVVYEALHIDLFVAAEAKIHTRLGTRLNYENTGISSMFRRSGRGLRKMDAGVYEDQFLALDAAWESPQVWDEMLSQPWAKDALPMTYDLWARWAENLASNGDDAASEKLEAHHYAALYYDLRDQDMPSNAPQMLKDADAAAASFDSVDAKERFAEVHEDWHSTDVWKTIYTYSPKYTPGYFLNAVDMEKNYDGISARDENQQIYIKLFIRTMFMSLVIMGSCILLGYPVAWILANLPSKTANLLMILVLLPFWTSLLVRTSAWKVMLQQQGVINDVLVWLGLVDDSARLIMMNNQLGTIIAMTHILLPFMILPLYSVMSTIPPSYLRAAKSLGATNWTAFWRVYFPQSVPGIGAGSILVFILAIGYYITPEIVGGTSGTFISNRIAYHISSSLNWGLAAALGSILLAVVLILYWAYDKIVGIDNVKLG